MVLLDGEAQVEAYFGMFEDSANLAQDTCMICTKCIIGSLIILYAPDGTPR
jgi:hypothetical protein